MINYEIIPTTRGSIIQPKVFKNSTLKIAIATPTKSPYSLSDFDFHLNTGIDLKTAKEYRISQDQKLLISTQSKLALLDGFVAHLLPKSGVSLNTPLFIPNAPATIEASYRGEIKVILGIHSDYYPTFKDYKGKIFRDDRTGEIVIKKHTKIAQLSIYPTFLAESYKQVKIFLYQDDYVYNNFDKLFPSQRGSGGFGSTGV